MRSMSGIRRNSFMMLFLFLIYAVSVSSQELPGFRVAGRYLYDKCGEKVILRGVNKMTVWTDINGTSFSEIAKTGANCVRIVWTTGGAVDKFDNAITTCRENNMIPMVELHDATGDWSLLSTCVDWWVRPEVVEIIQKHEEYLLVNVANECGNQVSAEDFEAGYKTAISRMREAGIRTPIVIDAAKYGQDINILQATGPALLEADPDHNLLFSVHMWWPEEYGYSDQTIVDEIAQSVQMNLPLIVGEFGNTAANCVGEINYNLILKECQENEIGWLAWSWGPGNSDCAAMDMTTESTYETLQGWGLEVAVTDPNSIENTSVRPQFMQTGVCEGSDVTRFSVSVISSGRGSVTASPNRVMVDSGQTITFTAVADENNEFLNWSGSVDGSQNPLTITVEQNINLTAVFSDNGPAVGEELVDNGDFEGDSEAWSFGPWGDASGSAGVQNGELVITMTAPGEYGYNAQLVIEGLDIAEGTSYVVSFDARAESAYELSTNVGLAEDPYTTYSGYQSFELGTEMETYTYEFTMSEAGDQTARMVFDVGTYEGAIHFDNISVKPIANTGVVVTPAAKSAFSPVLLKCKRNGILTITTDAHIRGSFELLSVTGKCVAKLNTATYRSGSHDLDFGFRNLSAGMYVLRLNDSDIRWSQIVNIMK